MFRFNGTESPQCACWSGYSCNTQRELQKKNLLYVVPMISCCNIVLLKYRLFSYMCLINIHSETFFLVIKFRWCNTTKANL
jgi:hypothetical protein